MRKIMYLLAVCLLVFIACQNESNDYQTDISLRNKPNPGNSELARLWASGFVNDINVSTRSHHNTVVSSVFPLCSKDIYSSRRLTRNLDYEVLPDTILYVVNLGNNDGFMLVSTDTLLPGVMAYIEHGSLREGEGITSHELLHFLDGYKYYYIKEAKTRDGLVPGPSGDEPAYPGVWRTDEHIPALLSTEWGQGYPYNLYCFTSDGSQALAGCMAIATAQIVAYYSYPSSYSNHIYDWNSILQSSNVSPTNQYAVESVANLVHDIGILDSLKYGVNVTTGRYKNTALAFDAFGYHYLRTYDCNFDSISVDLYLSRPVYVRGEHYDIWGNREGHAWVIDGMAIRSYYVMVSYIDEQGVPHEEETRSRTYNLFHCNWGRGGSDNGYFVSGAFQNKYDIENDTIIQTDTNFNILNYSYRKIYPL